MLNMITCDCCSLLSWITDTDVQKDRSFSTLLQIKWRTFVLQASLYKTVYFANPVKSRNMVPYRNENQVREEH